jgi:DNA-dependent protein kinase catalytic subunit
VRSKFARSYAVFTICSYVLGIGDRHLDNFLLDTTDGSLVGIDFGCAFGQGVHLGVPGRMDSFIH